MSPGETDEHAYLGEEFLTWIWFRWETDGGEFRMPDGATVGIAFDDLLAFAPGREGETEQTLRKGLPTRAEEARTALRGGRRVQRARLVLAEGQRQWNVTLEATTMTLRSVRLPDDDEDANSAEERSAARIADWLRLEELVQGLYGLFLRERLHPEYSAAQRGAASTVDAAIKPDADRGIGLDTGTAVAKIVGTQPGVVLKT